MHCTDSKKRFVRKYVIEQGFYSYNAAGDTDDPVSRWIGREVKKFLAEAHIHLPVLLRAANAPPDLLPEAVFLSPLRSAAIQSRKALDLAVTSALRPVVAVLVLVSNRMLRTECEMPSFLT